MKIPTVPLPALNQREATQAAFDAKTKPIGSLGRLEWICGELAAIQGQTPPVVDRRRVLVFAADHGITAEGVSAYPQAVTHEMLKNFAAGGAAINVLSRRLGAALEVIDVGVVGEAVPGVLNRKIRPGTRNFSVEAAMTKSEVEAAFEVGLDRAQVAYADGMRLLALGEMGIGNTASASALLSLLTDSNVEQTVGRGAGLDNAGLAHKVEVLRRAVELHSRPELTAEEALCCVGGLELAALAGAAVGAAANRVPVLIDGFICTVAALVAAHLSPECRGAMIFSHRSSEPGHALALRALDAEPLFDLGLRLGEGSGAALAISLVDAAVQLFCEMATFAGAGVSRSTRRSSDAA